MKFIDLDRQYRAYRQEINSAIQAVLDSGQFILGDTVRALEDALARFTGSRFAVGTSSGTDGLLLCLMAQGIGPGDEIITTPFTFIATAEVITMLGATPQFVDIQPDTFNISPEAIEQKIKERKKAGGRIRGIIPVSLYGQCADMDEINAIARENRLFVVEDACQSFGATYRKRYSCALSSMAVTSFFPSKPLGCYGDGGMIFTDDETLADTLKAMRVHGQNRRYRHDMKGINGRLDAIQAAVVLAKLKHFREELQARELAAKRYNNLISEQIPDVQIPHTKRDRTCVYAQYTVRIPDGRRDDVVKELEQRAIPCAVHYPLPLHMQKVFAQLQVPEGSLPVAEKAAREVLSLPMHAFITEQEQEAVVKALSDALK